MRLLRAEFSRFFARRFTRIMLLSLVVALAIIAAVVAANTQRPTPEALRDARIEAEQVRQDCERDEQAESERTGRDEDFGCQDITAANFLPYTLEFRWEAPTLLLVYFGLLALLGYLVGASFVGAEWSSGGMANLLLWRTQRIRVLLGKLTTLLVSVLGTGVVLAVGWVATIWTIARFRGELGDLTEAFWFSLSWAGMRGMTLALVAALVGAAIASLGRRTAAALGVLIGYLVVWEIGARIVMEALAVPGPDRFVLSSYVVGLVNGRFEIYDWRNCWEGGCDPLLVITPWLGGGVLAGLALLATFFAAWSFHRRDVT